MKRTALLILYIASAAISAMAQPRFVPDNEILKVGAVAFQEPKTFHLQFTNKGDQPLSILSVHPSCGCVTANYTTSPVAPNAKGNIAITFDAKMLGAFYKDVEIVTNETDEPTYVAIEGYVTREVVGDDSNFPIDLGNVRINKDYLEYDNIYLGDLQTAEFKVANMERNAFRPQLMHLPPYLTAEYDPEVIAPGRVGTVRVTLDSDKLPSMGLTQTSIYLSRYMGDKISSTNEIAVSAVLLPSQNEMESSENGSKPVLHLSDTEVHIALGNAQKQNYDVTLTNAGTEVLNIKQLQVFGKLIEVSLNNRAIKPGKSSRLRITALQKFLNKSKTPPRVLIISDDPDQPKAIINVDVK